MQIIRPRLVSGLPSILNTGQCLAMARSLANDRRLWEPHLRFDPDSRYYHLLHLDAAVEIWLLCWVGPNDTGWHDHGASSAGVVVAQGAIMEEVPTLAGPVSRRLGTGDSISMPPGHIHRMHAAHDTTGVSVHVYSPPLGRVAQYRADAAGRVFREDQDGNTPLVSGTAA